MALAQSGAIKQQIAFCFADPKSGRFMLGGAPDSVSAGPFQWMPLARGGMYELPLNEIAVTGQAALDVPRESLRNGGASVNGAILDSGTNILLVPSDVYGELQRGMTAACANKECSKTIGTFFADKCMNLTQSAIDAMPSLDLTFDGENGTPVKLHMPPSSLFVRNSNQHNEICLGIKNTGRDGFLIVGDTLMWEYTVVLDRVNQRAGWAPVNKQGCRLHA